MDADSPHVDHERQDKASDAGEQEGGRGRGNGQGDPQTGKVLISVSFNPLTPINLAEQVGTLWLEAYAV